MEITLSFFNLGSLSLLVGINEPLEVVLLELADIWVILLFGDLDALIPSVQLLIHGHGLFNLVVLEENSLGAMELLVEHCQLCLHSEVLNAFLCDELVDLAQVVCFSDVTKRCVASLGNIEILLLDRQLGECLPVCLDLRGHVEGLQNLHCLLKSLVLKGRTELNQCLLKLIRVGVCASVNDDLGLTLSSLNAFNITLDLIHGNFIRLIDGVPNAQVVAVLGNDNIGVGNPAYILAVVKKSLLLLLLDVVKVELSTLVSEQQLGAAGVQLQVIYL